MPGLYWIISKQPGPSHQCHLLCIRKELQAGIRATKFILLLADPVR